MVVVTWSRSTILALRTNKVVRAEKRMSRACKFSSDNRSNFLVAGMLHYLHYIIQYHHTCHCIFSIFSELCLLDQKQVNTLVKYVIGILTISMLYDDPSPSSILRIFPISTGSGSFLDDRHLITPTLLTLPQQRGKIDHTLDTIVFPNTLVYFRISTTSRLCDYFYSTLADQVRGHYIAILHDQHTCCFKSRELVKTHNRYLHDSILLEQRWTLMATR